MAKVKLKANAKTKKKPVKAGSTHGKNTGGILNAKVSTIVKKSKNK